jgi:hypothetical protein
MQQGGVYVMMMIWAGIYFGVGSVFEYLDIHRYIGGVIISATHEFGTIGDFIADPNYNITRAQAIEYYGHWDPIDLDHKYIYVSSFTHALPVIGEFSLLRSVGIINSKIDSYAPDIWAGFCVIGGFLGLMMIFKARQDGGDHGISEFDY